MAQVDRYLSCRIQLTNRFNEAVKVALATRQAEVVEMYQPMTDLMRQCQDAITECMEAMLVELKRDHSLVRSSIAYGDRADLRIWTLRISMSEMLNSKTLILSFG